MPVVYLQASEHILLINVGLLDAWGPARIPQEKWQFFLGGGGAASSGYSACGARSVLVVSAKIRLIRSAEFKKSD